MYKLGNYMFLNVNTQRRKEFKSGGANFDGHHREGECCNLLHWVGFACFLIGIPPPTFKSRGTVAPPLLLHH